MFCNTTLSRVLIGLRKLAPLSRPANRVFPHFMWATCNYRFECFFFLDEWIVLRSKARVIIQFMVLLYDTQSIENFNSMKSQLYCAVKLT